MCNWCEVITRRYAAVGQPDPLPAKSAFLTETPFNRTSSRRLPLVDVAIATLIPGVEDSAQIAVGSGAVARTPRSSPARWRRRARYEVLADANGARRGIRACGGR
jgi:hypothetical protein